MFEKLISLLPYNPNLMDQMRFYSKRLEAESVIRRIGLIVIVLAFFVQFFGVITPTQKTSAYSTNDLVNGGFSSASEAKNDCSNNIKDYGDIMATFGISCDSIGNASTVTLSSTDTSGGQELYSTGWLPIGSKNPNTGRTTNETPISILNNTDVIYSRLLHSWDTGASSSYKALKVTSSTGQTYYLLYTCGNLTFFGQPNPLPRCKYNTSILSDSSNCFQPCAYNSSISSSSSQCAPPCKYNQQILSTSASCFQPCTYNKAIPASSNQCAPPCKYNQQILSTSASCGQPCQFNQSILASNSSCPSPCKYNASIPSTSSSCQPTPTICQYNSSIPSTSPNCFQPCQYNSSIAATSSSCFQPCQYNSSIAATSSSCFQACQYNSTIPSDSPDCAPPCQYNSSILSTNSQCFQVCKYNNSLPATSPNCFQPCQYNSSIAATSSSCFQPCQYNSSISSSDSGCKPCQASTSSEDTLSCVSISKTAADLTDGNNNANGSTAQAGDTILYTLTANNSGSAQVSGYTFQDDMSYVLDYANIVSLHGGSINSSNVVSWPSVNIPAGSSATEQITVQIKNPIPAMTISAADPDNYDMILNNVYGNAVNINLPKTTISNIATTSAALPNTGPGDSIAIVAVIVILAGYFYSRSRLLAKETELAIRNNRGEF